MRCFEWKDGELREGLSLVADEKLGQVVFLGEAGRGRRYEKVALGRRNPAEVVNGRVLDAHPVKITLPARDGKPEKVFYVIEKPRIGNGDAVLVQVYTLTSYIRGASGRCSTVEGQPETLISGYGAFGDAGRVGSWSDGLLVMKPGDVLRVSPSRGHSYALWLDGGKPVTATWQDYENLQAVKRAEALVAEACKPEALDVVYGQMPAFTWSGGQITKGLRVMKGATGPVISLGESGRGRFLVEVPLVGIMPIVQNDRYGKAVEVVEEASVAKLDEKVAPVRSWEKPKIKTIYGLTKIAKPESAFLVRVCTGLDYTRRGNGKWEAWKGNPNLLCHGCGADGDAGGIGSWSDDLVVIREGDVLYVRPSGDGPAYALFVQGSQVRSEEWTVWKAADGKSDAAFYVAKGTAPWGHTPAEWVGSVVSVLGLGERTMIGNVPTPAFAVEHTGELISVSFDRIVLNLGWDGRDRQLVTINSGVWVRLDTEKKVTRLDASAEQEREQAKAEVARLRAQAKAVREAGYVSCLESELQERVVRVADGRKWASYSGDLFDFSLASTEAIREWASRAEAVLAEVRAAEAGAKALASRQEAGEVLVNFTASHRRGGMTGNGDGWVIRPDGSFRDRDSDDVPRHKSDGMYCWTRVQPEELALRWFCHHMGDVSGNSTFEVAKLPMGGCTANQLAVVRRIEGEIGAPEGAFGLDPEINRVNGERLTAIREAAGKVLKRVPEFSYYQVAGQNGVTLDGATHTLRANFTAPFAESCDGRDAQVVRAARAADGMVEFLAYEKYGQTNFAMRWRPLREDEVAVSAPAPASSPETEKKLTHVETADFREQLRKKFGRAR